MLKLENQELATRLYDFENVVHQVHVLKEENAKLIESSKGDEELITLRQQNIDLRTRLEAIDELVHQIHTLNEEKVNLHQQLQEK